MKRAPILFLVTLAAYTLTAGGHLYSPDEEIDFRTTRALATGHGLAIEPMASGEFTRAPRPPRSDGRVYAQYGIGQPILAVPFYRAGAALGRLGTDAFWQRLYGTPAINGKLVGYAPSAAELAPRWACSWFNILLGSLMAALLYLVCFELTRHATASTFAALLYALGSMAWPHSRPFFTESCATFFILLAWYGVLRALRGRMVPWCLLAGAAAGYGALVRMDSVLAYPGLGLLLAVTLVARARRRGAAFWPAWVAFCIPASLAGAVLLGLNVHHFGGMFQTGYAAQPEGVKFSTPLLAGLYGFLFGIGKGLFFFSPALVLGFWGWRPLAELTRRRQPWLVAALAAAILVPFLIQAKWQNWPGGWCWGPRHIFIIHVFLAIPIAALLARAWSAPVRIAALVALIVGIGVQLLACSQDFIYFYQRFFRSPGDRNAFFVTYDPADMVFWDNFYHLSFRSSPKEEPYHVPLFPPRPIQDSLYLPQWSVWTGYPQMLREGTFDNFWTRAWGLSGPIARPPRLPDS